MSLVKFYEPESPKTLFENPPIIVIVLGLAGANEGTPAAEFMSFQGWPVAVVPLLNSDPEHPEKLDGVKWEAFCDYLRSSLVEIHRHWPDRPMRIAAHSLGVPLAIDVVANLGLEKDGIEIDSFVSLAGHLDSKDRRYKWILRLRNFPPARALFYRHCIKKGRFEQKRHAVPGAGPLHEKVALYHQAYAWVPQSFVWECFRGSAIALNSLERLKCPFFAIDAEWDHRVPPLRPALYKRISGMETPPVMIEGSSHYLLLDSEEVYWKIIIPQRKTMKFAFVA